MNLDRLKFIILSEFFIKNKNSYCIFYKIIQNKSKTHFKQKPEILIHICLTFFEFIF